ncbi:MAG: GNAT family N-acetyltransferase, partial [Oscillospiraceae bacterium]|nr:GNAT family N-acetyltransferase [Oscillospiraceae bacterium]
YYAYIIDAATDEPVGEVNIHFDFEYQEQLIGITIEARHRGRGFSEPALRLLADIAFYERGYDKIIDTFPADELRRAAERVFAKIGFVRESDILLVLTRERYENLKR